MGKDFGAIGVLFIGTVLGGCSDMKHSHDQQSAHEDGRTNAHFSESGTEHPHSHPPVADSPVANPNIDCPLHDKKAGHHHQPFGDVDEYIAHLDRKDRDAWQVPDAVVASLGLKGTETVADVGAGSGYFSFRFAKKLPEGKVLALDVEPEMVAHIQKRAGAEGFNNVSALLSTPDDPSVPRSADWVFVCDVLHHVAKPEAWLSRLHDQLRPGARVAIIEFKQGELPIGPPEWMKIAPEKVVGLMSASGFALTSRDDDLLAYQHLFVFVRQ
jgi:SAM-dependent methyltransferase